MNIPISPEESDFNLTNDDLILICKALMIAQISMTPLEMQQSFSILNRIENLLPPIEAPDEKLTATERYELWLAKQGKKPDGTKET